MRAKRFSLIKPSTLQFIQEARRTPGYSFYDWLHGMVYARFPYLYIGIGVGEHPLTKRFGPWFERLSKVFRRDKDEKVSSSDPEQVHFADTYHGKVVPLEAARQLVMVNEPVVLPNLEKIIPYKLAKDIVLQNPDHIVVLECPCRSSRQNPCLPMDVCLIVGEPFASFIIEHHPQKSRWITQGEAVDILKAEDERGHVHHAFFKDAMLGRFYAICNCCSCCCGAMQAHQHGVPMLAGSGYLAQVDHNACAGCAACVEVCQFGALTIVDFVSHANPDLCMGCGICVNHCDNGAITLLRAPDRGEPLEIFSLIAQAEQHE